MESDEGEKLRDAILDLLNKRGEGKSICPSEAARQAFPEGWRCRMAKCREIARDLAREGKIEICQRGEPVSPDQTLRGPIRLR